MTAGCVKSERGPTSRAFAHLACSLHGQRPLLAAHTPLVQETPRQACASHFSHGARARAAGARASACTLLHAGVQIAPVVLFLYAPYQFHVRSDLDRAAHRWHSRASTCRACLRLLQSAGRERTTPERSGAPGRFGTSGGLEREGLESLKTRRHWSVPSPHTLEPLESRESFLSSTLTQQRLGS